MYYLYHLTHRGGRWYRWHTCLQIIATIRTRAREDCSACGAFPQLFGAFLQLSGAFLQLSGAFPRLSGAFSRLSGALGGTVQSLDGGSFSASTSAVRLYMAWQFSAHSAAYASCVSLVFLRNNRPKVWNFRLFSVSLPPIQSVRSEWAVGSRHDGQVPSLCCTRARVALTASHSAQKDVF